MIRGCYMMKTEWQVIAQKCGTDFGAAASSRAIQYVVNHSTNLWHQLIIPWSKLSVQWIDFPFRKIKTAFAIFAIHFKSLVQLEHTRNRYSLQRKLTVHPYERPTALCLALSAFGYT